MYRSTIPHGNRSYLYAGLALLLAMIVAAGTYVLTHQQSAVVSEVESLVNEPVSIPVVEAAPQKIDLGAGYKLEGGKIVAPAMVIKPAPSKLDLGAGYTLNLNVQGGEIAAPVRPSTAYQKMDMGAGYTLEVTGDVAQISAPAPYTAPQERILQKLDLGAGYSLILNAADGHLIAPLNPLAVTAATHKTDLGGGYWLVTSGENGQIVQSGSS